VRNGGDDTVLGLCVGNCNVLEQVGITHADFDAPLIEARQGTQKQERNPVGTKASPKTGSLFLREVGILTSYFEKITQERRIAWWLV
jgi:hypothetical protein